MLRPIRIPAGVLRELKRICLDALPGKAYGLIGGTSPERPESVHPCRTNLRQAPPWKARFDSYGEFYRDPDRGFVIDPAEYLEISREMAGAGRRPVGVFHSHRCLLAEPSVADLDLHSDSGLICYIVSVRRPERPEVRAYRIDRGRCEEIPVEAIGAEAAPLAVRRRDGHLRENLA